MGIRGKITKQLHLFLKVLIDNTPPCMTRGDSVPHPPDSGRYVTTRSASCGATNSLRHVLICTYHFAEMEKVQLVQHLLLGKYVYVDAYLINGWVINIS